MAKWQNDDMPDAALNWLKTNMDQVCICSSQPTTYAEATSTYNLGSASHSITGSPEDYAGGRQIAIPAKNDITITSAGDAQHYALVDTVGNELLYVTTFSAQKTVAVDDKANIAAFNARLADVS